MKENAEEKDDKEKQYKGKHDRLKGGYDQGNIVSPMALFLFLQLMQKIVSESVPSYIRSLGTVTEIQGQVFLIDLVAIIVVLALIIYAVTSIFGVLTGTEPER